MDLLSEGMDWEVVRASRKDRTIWEDLVSDHWRDVQLR